MQSHPLDGDGITPELYKLLARVNKASTTDTKLSFRVPDTILYYGCASFWYYYDHATRSLQKHPAKSLEKQTIFENFGRTKKTARSGIVALFATWRTSKLDIRYMTREDLRRFLFVEKRQDLFGILQKFVEPKTEHAETLQVIWSPTMSFSIRRINTSKIYDRQKSPNERCCIFDGPSFASQEHFCNPHTTAMLSRHCQCIVRFFSSLESTHSIGRLVCYMQEDADDNFWLLFTTSVRILEAPDRMSVPESPLDMPRSHVVSPLMIFSAEKMSTENELLADTIPRKKVKRILPPPARLLSRFYTCSAEDEESLLDYKKALEGRISKRAAEKERIAEENEVLFRDLDRLEKTCRNLCNLDDIDIVVARSATRASNPNIREDDEGTDSLSQTATSVSPSHRSGEETPAVQASPTPLPIFTAMSFSSLNNAEDSQQVSNLADSRGISIHARSLSVCYLGDVSDPMAQSSNRSRRRTRRKTRKQQPAVPVFEVTNAMQSAAKWHMDSAEAAAVVLRDRLMAQATIVSDIFYPIADEVETSRRSDIVRSRMTGRNPISRRLSMPFTNEFYVMIPDDIMATLLRYAAQDVDMMNLRRLDEVTAAQMAAADRGHEGEVYQLMPPLPPSSVLRMVAGKLQEKALVESKQILDRGRRRAARMVWEPHHILMHSIRSMNMNLGLDASDDLGPTPATTPLRTFETNSPDTTGTAADRRRTPRHKRSVSFTEGSDPAIRPPMATTGTGHSTPDPESSRLSSSEFLMDGIERTDTVELSPKRHEAPVEDAVEDPPTAVTAEEKPAAHEEGEVKVEEEAATQPDDVKPLQKEEPSQQAEPPSQTAPAASSGSAAQSQSVEEANTPAPFDATATFLDAGPATKPGSDDDTPAWLDD